MSTVLNLKGNAPPPTWHLLKEIARPLGAWRLEPLRIWEVTPRATAQGAQGGAFVWGRRDGSRVPRVSREDHARRPFWTDRREAVRRRAAGLPRQRGPTGVTDDLPDPERLQPIRRW